MYNSTNEAWEYGLIVNAWGDYNTLAEHFPPFSTAPDLRPKTVHWHGRLWQVACLVTVGNIRPTSVRLPLGNSRPLSRYELLLIKTHLLAAFELLNSPKGRALDHFHSHLRQALLLLVIVGFEPTANWFIFNRSTNELYRNLHNGLSLLFSNLLSHQMQTVTYLSPC
jgi:hypothetical protein